MREPQLVRERDPVAAADAERGRRPLADAVEREDRRFLERRREEGAGRVRFVVLGEDEALLVLPAQAACACSRGRYSFSLQPERHGLAGTTRNPAGANAR